MLLHGTTGVDDRNQARTTITFPFPMDTDRLETAAAARTVPSTSPRYVRRDEPVTWSLFPHQQTWQVSNVNWQTPGRVGRYVHAILRVIAGTHPRAHTADEHTFRPRTHWRQNRLCGRCCRQCVRGLNDCTASLLLGRARYRTTGLSEVAVV